MMSDVDKCLYRHVVTLFTRQDYRDDRLYEVNSCLPARRTIKESGAASVTVQGP